MNNCKCKDLEFITIPNRKRINFNKRKQIGTKITNQLKRIYYRYTNSNTFDFAVNKYGRTPKMCSCFMCGNPRKFFKELTMQERKNNEKYKSYLKEENNIESDDSIE